MLSDEKRDFLWPGSRFISYGPAVKLIRGWEALCSQANFLHKRRHELRTPTAQVLEPTLIVPAAVHGLLCIMVNGLNPGVQLFVQCDRPGGSSL